MTRVEHIAWCKQRAKAEIEYTKDPKQGIISMMSDIGKHPETNSDTLRLLCVMELASSPNITSAIRFIDGFN